MIINHNMNAMNAHRNMNSSTIAQGKAMEKLSSGLRINRAADDAAGLAISEKMRSQIRGLNQASRNAQDGISMIQTAEGALSETQAIGQRMRELAVQSANGTYTDEDRALINQEFLQLKSEIDRIATDTEFNGNKVLNGSLSGKEINSDRNTAKVVGVSGGTINNNTDIQAIFGSIDSEELAKLGEGVFNIKISHSDTDESITIDLIDKSHFNGGKEYIMDSFTFIPAGDNESFELAGVQIELDGLNTNIESGESAIIEFTNEVTKDEDGVTLQVGANKNQSIGISIDTMRSRELGLGGVSVATAADAQDAIQLIDDAVSRVSSQRADLGATQNRLEHTIASTDNTAENLQASESRIRDVDMAKEMMNLTRLNVLQQASQAMLAQANQAPQNVLSILK
ncbi:flagellin N-terminal helical domain-containing protein [Candidatus Arthromitus sp. SFB-turkey]|uniref:flagellin N-terminal helical domain-containing protein n=1 Tax=Candidatus Arthromitus sp. SFB-turkey TaxID=1840217 RepID=UPI0007F42C2F|nr:flagellin [Candidatus Arthromitus sp. SFB-turkey]OAT89151.1 flagellar biosynthesis protein FliC [Candidatus Arthromitus sp. SFB-turkey]